MMKAEKFGLPGSVIVVGLIYLMALAFAPTSALSAPDGRAIPVPDASAGLAAGGTTLAVCPNVLHAGYGMNRFVAAHRDISRQPDDVPVGPGWGSGRLTMF